MNKTETPANTPPAIAPTLQSAPQVTEAPGRGIIPNVSQHTAAIPLLYELDAQPMEQVSELLQRQYLTGAHATLVKWTAKKGATVAAAPPRQRADYLDHGRRGRSLFARAKISAQGWRDHDLPAQRAA